MNRLAIAALLGCVVQFATVHAQEPLDTPSAPFAPLPERSAAPRAVPEPAMPGVAPPPETAPPGAPLPEPANRAETRQPSPPTENGRYSYHPQADSLLRLDSRTGQVATCNRSPAGWACRATPEERSALEAEIGRLQSENAALKKELASRGAPSPGAGAGAPDKPLAEAPPRPPQPVPGPSSPMETEMAKLRTVIGDVWKRLVEMVAELQRDLRKD